MLCFQDGEDEDTGVDDEVKEEAAELAASSVPEPPPPSENGTEFPRSLLQRYSYSLLNFSFGHIIP